MTVRGSRACLAIHAGIQGSAQGPKPSDPGRIQALLFRRVASIRTLPNGEDVKDLFDPTGRCGILAGFDVGGEYPSFITGIIIQAAYARVDEPDHVLRTGGIGPISVLLAEDLPDKDRRILVGKPVAPEPSDGLACARRHPRTVHEPKPGFEANHDHGSRRGGVERRNKRLVYPTAGEGEPLRDTPDDPGRLFAGSFCGAVRHHDRVRFF